MVTGGYKGKIRGELIVLAMATAGCKKLFRGNRKNLRSCGVVDGTEGGEEGMPK